MIKCFSGDSLSQVSVTAFKNTHLTLHALGSASVGAGLGCLSGRFQSLLLQLLLLDVYALCAFCDLHRLDGLLNTL